MLCLEILEAPSNQTPVGDTLVVGPAGATIGRVAKNTWQLSDDESQISRLHFEITFAGGSYTLIDHSTNGTYINASEEPVGNGVSAIISAGDQIAVGKYLISVSDHMVGAVTTPDLGTTPGFFKTEPEDVQEDAQATPLPSASAKLKEEDSGAFQNVSAAPLSDNIFSQPSATPSPSNRPSSGSAFAPPEPAKPGVQHNVSPAASSPGAAGLSVPVASVPPAVSERGFEPPPVPAGNRIPEGEDLSLNDPVFDAPLQPKPAARSGGGNSIPEDWFLEDEWQNEDLPQSTEEATSAPADIPSPQLPSIEPGPPTGTGDAVATPPVRTDNEPPVTPAAVSVPAGGTDLESAVRETLRQNLGAHVDVMSSSDLVNVVEQLASLMALATPRLMSALSSRTQFKESLRLRQTMIRARENNPLKFSTDPGEAQSALLLNNKPGMLNGMVALEEAFDELAMHQTALIAALKPALQSTVQSLSPGSIEAAAQNAGKTGGLPSLGGKGKFWDVYRQLYTKLAQDDGRDLEQKFLTALADHYENSINAIK